MSYGAAFREPTQSDYYNERVVEAAADLYFSGAEIWDAISCNPNWAARLETILDQAQSAVPTGALLKALVSEATEALRADYIRKNRRAG